MSFNVLVSDKFSAKGLAALKAIKGVRTTYSPGLGPDQLKAKLARADALIVRSATKVTSELIDDAPLLKVIGRAGSGVDNIDVPYATKRGIVVMNTPGGNTITTAEHTIALMCSMARNIPQAHRSLAEGRWEKSKWIGTELTGKVLGVIGLGNIGSIVAKRASAMDMNVIGHDPFIAPDRAAELGVTLVELDQLLKEADIITVHVPKSKDTASLIDAEAIRKMKRGVRIINCARGGIVNEQDLLAALESGKVAAAAIDVYISEPMTDSPLFNRGDVVVTPHLGASTVEAQDKVAVAVVEQIRDMLLDKVVRNAVNVPGIPPEMMDAVRPYQTLAGKLGSLLGQLAPRDVRQVDVEYRGPVAKLPHAPLNQALLCGMMSQFTDDANEINAASLATERGIKLIETRSESHRDHSNLIKVTLHVSRGKLSVAGTKRETGELRLVDYNGYPVDIEPQGQLLIVQNKDLPGVLGSISTFLGRRKINIATVQLGRLKSGSNAATLIALDHSLDKRQLADLAKLRNVNSVNQVEL
ncbi:MAG: phosphoglycerate dehydrogenase [Candidatus Alcyoniella australis]|nr:phosphoglycerate dehydrogenase [Candidatus Alcyoniella australis]